MKPTTISIFTAPQGHRSIAAAAAAAFNPATHKVFVNEYRGKEFDLYAPLHLYFPGLVKYPYRFTNTSSVQRVALLYAQRAYEKKLLNHLRLQKPDVVISTWFMLNHLLEEHYLEYSRLFINIVSDPRTFVNFAAAPKAFNFVFDRTTSKNLQRLDVTKDSIIESGWFTRPQFETPYNKTTIRRQLNLDPNQLTFLIVGGSEGSAMITKIIPALINCDQPIQAIFICGTNKKLFSVISRLASINQNLNPRSQATIIPLGFTTQIHHYLQAADLVLGKAGPNLIFEAVATKTPFFALTHVSGHEDGNLQLIKDYRLGYIEENPLKASRLLKDIINKPQQLERFTPHLKKLADYNKQSKPILNRFVSSQLKTN